MGGNGGRPTEALRGELARGGKGLIGPQGEDSLRRTREECVVVFRRCELEWL